MISPLVTPNTKFEMMPQRIVLDGIDTAPHLLDGYRVEFRKAGAEEVYQLSPTSLRVDFVLLSEAAQFYQQMKSTPFRGKRLGVTYDWALVEETRSDGAGEKTVRMISSETDELIKRMANERLVEFLEKGPDWSSTTHCLTTPQYIERLMQDWSSPGRMLIWLDQVCHPVHVSLVESDSVTCNLFAAKWKAFNDSRPMFDYLQFLYRKGLLTRSVFQAGLDLPRPDWLPATFTQQASAPSRPPSSLGETQLAEFIPANVWQVSPVSPEESPYLVPAPPPTPPPPPATIDELDTDQH